MLLLRSQGRKQEKSEEDKQKGGGGRLNSWREMGRLLLLLQPRRRKRKGRKEYAPWLCAREIEGDYAVPHLQRLDSSVQTLGLLLLKSGEGPM